MNDERFWSLIEPGRLDEDPKNRLRVELQKLDATELVGFQERFDAAVARACRWDLWGAAHLIEQGCTEERFAHFRHALVLRGRAVFEAAVRNADSLAYVNVRADQDAGFLALDVYEAKTGGELPRSRPEGATAPAGSPLRLDDPAELKRRLPKLAAKVT